MSKRKVSESLPFNGFNFAITGKHKNALMDL